jgi:hypothetical protein
LCPPCSTPMKNVKSFLISFLDLSFSSGLAMPLSCPGNSQTGC